MQSSSEVVGSFGYAAVGSRGERTRLAEQSLRKVWGMRCGVLVKRVLFEEGQSRTRVAEGRTRVVRLAETPEVVEIEFVELDIEDVEVGREDWEVCNRSSEFGLEVLL